MATTSQESKGFYKLSWVQRIGFGAGDLAQNLIYQTICMYLLFFYTDVYVLGGDAAKSAGLAGTMFLVVRLVDVLWDPLVGTFVLVHGLGSAYRTGDNVLTRRTSCTVLAVLTVRREWYSDEGPLFQLIARSVHLGVRLDELLYRDIVLTGNTENGFLTFYFMQFLVALHLC